MTYETLEPGPDGWEPWEKYTKKFKLACCDCNLVHLIEMKVDSKRRIWMRWKRHERATAALRRAWNNKKRLIWKNLFE